MKIRSCKYVILALLAFFVTSCNMPERNVDKNVLYTIAASTIQAENNRIASLTPPTPTSTLTETPTITFTPTITSTPTIPPTATWITHPAGSAEVLILYYNDVANNANEDPYYQWESPLNVPSVEFEQQVRILYELGYTSIGLSQLVKVLLEGGELPPKPVMFTFDSSKLGQYKNAYPILKKYGMAGNLMLVAAQVDTKNCLSSDQIKEMMNDGWELGSSGYDGNHDPAYYGQEIGKSKILLEEKFGVPIEVFAYPGGIPDAGGVMASKVSSSLYKAAMGKQHVTKQSRDNLYYLGRFEITKGLPLNDFLSYLPWKEGNISEETMNWTLPTVTFTPPAALLQTQETPAP